ncbi:hypothetical protein FE782_16180 [Paenibacillus antri]|uniref:Uncharacterized protein n=2 Tax=Paenibacillus antri TaxID=2582848 RepID=A0A5R9G4P6_9BACL|nr:hypothetical protein FE782_16180 [Paenibacillus antri]
MYGTTQLQPKKPLVVAAWSVAFPGFGHLLLNKYLRGYALLLWEFFINQRIQLNTAMVYSFNGQFQAARDILDPKLMGLYIPVYLFAIWDSYRTTVDLNKLYVLADRENAPTRSFTIGALEINYLDKRKPWLAAMWSAAIPSIGQLYMHRIVFAASVLLYTIFIVENSRLLLSIHYLILGDVQTSSAVLDVQWVLYFPSFYFFTIYDAYINAVENNNLYDDDLRNYLIRKYQPAGKVIRPGKKVV